MLLVRRAEQFGQNLVIIYQYGQVHAEPLQVQTKGVWNRRFYSDV